MKILLMAASSRKGSVNKKLINESEKILSTRNCNLVKLDLENFLSIGYSGDIEENQGIPDIVKKFGAELEKVEKVIFSIPEYNSSLPGVFKNLIDWVSRLRPSPWQNKKMLITTASPSIQGGSRSHLHALHIFQGLGVNVLPRTLNLSNAYGQFDSNCKIKDKTIYALLDSILKQFLEF
ncbi:MAG: NAD(P)H-dependent oxidoreductase [Rickettsiales bacterium]